MGGITDEVMVLFYVPNYSSRTMAPGMTASNKIQYQESLQGGGDVKRGRRVMLTNLPSPMTRLSRKCAILDVSQ
jgi:hypothetical protein